MPRVPTALCSSLNTISSPKSLLASCFWQVKPSGIVKIASPFVRWLGGNFLLSISLSPLACGERAFSPIKRPQAIPMITISKRIPILPFLCVFADSPCCVWVNVSLLLSALSPCICVSAGRSIFLSINLISFLCDSCSCAVLCKTA